MLCTCWNFIYKGMIEQVERNYVSIRNITCACYSYIKYRSKINIKINKCSLQISECFYFGIGEIVCFYFFKENIVIAVYIILLMCEKNINKLKQGFFIGVILCSI